MRVCTTKNIKNISIYNFLARIEKGYPGICTQPLSTSSIPREDLHLVHQSSMYTFPNSDREFPKSDQES
eukprot:SAG11_NODE_17644_length_512_cov_36.481840_1_plen_68_part_10